MRLIISCLLLMLFTISCQNFSDKSNNLEKLVSNGGLWKVAHSEIKTHPGNIYFFGNEYKGFDFDSDGQMLYYYGSLKPERASFELKEKDSIILILGEKTCKCTYQFIDDKLKITGTSIRENGESATVYWEVKNVINVDSF